MQTFIVAQGHAEPFHYPSQRRMDYFNQAITLACYYHLYIFTDFVPHPDIRYRAGNVLNAVTSLCIAVNVAYLNSELPRKLYNIAKRKYLRYKNVAEKVKLKAQQSFQEHQNRDQHSETSVN
jgi:hypothetical protein